MGLLVSKPVYWKLIHQHSSALIVVLSSASQIQEKVVPGECMKVNTG